MTTPDRPLALVTGASTGIGRELAATFARNGFDLLVVADNAELDNAVPALRELGATVTGLRLDLANPEQVEHLMSAVRQTGDLDALVVNAGIGKGGAFLGDSTLDDQLAIVKVNVLSAVHLAKRLVPSMVSRGRGRVLFTSSIAANAPGPYNSIYNATKAFLSSFGQALRSELRDTGVTVTVLMPGPTDTKFFQRAGMLDTKLGSGSKDDPKTVAEQGFQAMMKDKDHVVAGSLLNRLQSVAGHVLPDPLLAAVHRRMTAPGSGKH